MITKSQAVELGMFHVGKQVYSWAIKNKNGSFTHCKVNGKCQTWKTRPLEFKLPIKIGFKQHGYIHEENALYWFLTEQEASLAKTRLDNAKEEK